MEEKIQKRNKAVQNEQELGSDEREKRKKKNGSEKKAQNVACSKIETKIKIQMIGSIKPSALRTKLEMNQKDLKYSNGLNASLS